MPYLIQRQYIQKNESPTLNCCFLLLFKHLYKGHQTQHNGTVHKVHSKGLLFADDIFSSENYAKGYLNIRIYFGFR